MLQYVCVGAECVAAGAAPAGTAVAAEVWGDGWVCRTVNWSIYI